MRFVHRWFDETHGKNWGAWLVPWWESKGSGPIHILEIGTHEGRSTKWFAENLLEHQHSRLITIDNFSRHGGDVVREQFLENLKEFPNNEKITLIVKDSQVALPDIDENQFDLIYIDGDHRRPYVKKDTLEAFRLIKSGGRIMWDDYFHNIDNNPTLPHNVVNGVGDAVREYGNPVAIFNFKNTAFTSLTK